MSCYQNETLHDSVDIDQLKKEFFYTHYWLNHYRASYQRSVSAQEKLCDEHNRCVQQLEKKYTQEINQLKKELFEARYQANYYKAFHQRGVISRENLRDEHDQYIRKLKRKHEQEIDQLKSEIAKFKAKLRKRERQLFGKKSEKKNTSDTPSPRKGSKRQRGRQKDNKTPPKRDYSHLPLITETKDIPEKERRCQCCGALYSEINSTEDSEVLEVKVKAHRRLISRKKYRRRCNCQSSPIIITAAKAAKVLPKSRLGNSVWSYCLVQKFWHGQPLCRLIQGLEAQGMPLSISTIVGGFMKLLPLLKRVYQAILQQSLTDSHWHADETGWKVFEPLKGKVNHRWFLWVFKSQSTAVFILNPSRSTQVLKKFFNKRSGGIISCDRYSAYFCFACQSNDTFLVAYCWAHVRRDFLSVAKDWANYESWAMSWVEAIQDLYQLNRDRQSQKKDSMQATKSQRKLEQAIEALKRRADSENTNKDLADPCRKVIKSLQKHWNGLTTFVHHPHVPMDNNSAERELRKGVVGRKNYYGSGSIVSAEFTETAFTIIQTLLIWKINPQLWFNRFFDSMGGKWDKELSSWLPWNMDHDQLKDLSLKKHHDPPS